MTTFGTHSVCLAKMFESNTFYMCSFPKIEDIDLYLEELNLLAYKLTEGTKEYFHEIVKDSRNNFYFKMHSDTKKR